MDLWRRLVGCARCAKFGSFVLTPSSTLVLDVSLRVMPVFDEIAKHKRQSTTGHGSIPHLQLYHITFSLSHFLLSATIGATGTFQQPENG